MDNNHVRVQGYKYMINAKFARRPSRLCRAVQHPQENVKKRQANHARLKQELNHKTLCDWEVPQWLATNECRLLPCDPNTIAKHYRTESRSAVEYEQHSPDSYQSPQRRRVIAKEERGRRSIESGVETLKPREPDIRQCK